MRRRGTAWSFMNEDEAAARRSEAARWLTIAVEDARSARACLALDPPTFGVAAYLCQQAIEKVVKGLLILAGVEFSLTHDLDRLVLAAAPHCPDLLALFATVRSLTPWGIAYRYPSPDPVPEPLPESREIAQVLDIIDQLTALLRARIGG